MSPEGMNASEYLDWLKLPGEESAKPNNGEVTDPSAIKRLKLLKEYTALDLHIVPLKPETKVPVDPDWPTRPPRTLEEFEAYLKQKPKTNLGNVLHEPLVDIDHDCYEACAVSRLFLPPTMFAFGRTGKPMSHLFYNVDADPPLTGTVFKDPLLSSEKNVVVEIRALKKNGDPGLQTVLPPSEVFYDDLNAIGEVSFEAGYGPRAPANIEGDRLIAGVRALYASVLLARYFPPAGSRNAAFLALAGALARGGYAIEQARAIHRAIYQILWGHQAERQQCDAEVDATYKKIEDGEKATGLPSLIALGLDPRIADILREQLDLKAPAGEVTEIRDGNGPRPNWKNDTSQQKTRVWLDPPEPQPISGELPAVEPFRLTLLPESLRAFVQDNSERMQVPPDMIATPLVVAIGGVVGRRARIQPKRVDTSWVVVPNLWGGVVAAPGLLKTPTQRLALRPLSRIEARLHREHQAKLKEYDRQKLVFDVKQGAWKHKAKGACGHGKAIPAQPDDPPERPIAPRLIVNDATPEKLHEILADNPAGATYLRDELVGWLVGLDRQGYEQARSFFLEAWNGDGEFTSDRIGRGTVRAESPCISILGGLTPARLRSYLVDILEDKATNDGLIQRLQLLTWPDPPSKWESIDRLPDSAASQKVSRIFDNLAQLDAEAPCLLKFSEPAQALFDDWLAKLECRIRSNDDHPAIISHLSKFRSLMPSLTGLFSLVELAAQSDTSLISFFEAQPRLISLDSAQLAIAWCVYLESHARRVYSCIISPAVAAANELARRIKAGKLGQSTFRARAIYLKGWSKLDTPERAHQALSVLEDTDWIRSVLQGNNIPGRPPDEYIINPRIFTEASVGAAPNATEGL